MRGRDPATGRYIRLPDDSLTAAVAVVASSDLERMPRVASSRQERAWKLWRTLGVLHYPSSFKAAQVGRLGWNVFVSGEQLEPEQAEAAMAAITSPMGPREAARRLALNLDVAGEAFYARTADAWQVYATTTPKRSEKLKAADVVVRVWQADPEDPEKADSSVLAALDTAEEIRLMCALSRSQDRNRLAQRGILLVPKEGQFEEGEDFQSKLEESMTTPISDEYAASAVVPLKVTFPGDRIEQWRHLLIESPYDDKLMDRIEKAIVKLARELDEPPELLLGNFDSNHWNAWLSDESTYRAHIEPLGAIVGSAFARAMMELTGDAVEIEVKPDPSELLARRSSVSDAFEALRMGVVGFAYVRAAIGADEDDAPTPDELELIAALQGRTLPGTEVAQPATPVLPAAPEMPQETPEPAIAAAATARERELDELARRLVDIDVRLLHVLEGAAAVSCDHARAAALADPVGSEHVVREEMERLASAWRRQLAGARKVLRSLGVATSDGAWRSSEKRSVALLVEGLSAFVTQNLQRTNSDVPEVPVLLLRRVLAAAGGSGETVVAGVRNPAPTFADPQGFALGVLTLRDLKTRDVELVQWRFRYGALTREHPFLEHKAADGQFMTSDGLTRGGWFPGDHAGCLCWPDPVFRDVSVPDGVEDSVDIEEVA